MCGAINIQIKVDKENTKIYFQAKLKFILVLKHISMENKITLPPFAFQCGQLYPYI